jgi:MYXO-CTERM domain-containing protein
MKSKTLHRKPASIAKGRWAAYATAGAASAFTCANSAEAAIHYSGIIGSYSGRERTKSFRLQLDQPGDTFRLRHYVTLFTSDVYAHFGVRGLAGAGFAGFYCPSNPQLAGVSKLSRGQFISSRAFLARESGLIAGSFDVCSQQFGDGEIGFIGFKFNSGSGDQYGWVRIKMGNRADFWLIDYAYADLGEPIRAGQMSSNDTVPEEGSLGWLALGAAGLLAWRKRRSRAAR